MASATVDATHRAKLLEEAAAATAPLARIPVPRSAPATWAPYVPVLIESLADINFGDACFFDVEQYFESKNSDKTLVSKYLQKETALMTRLNEVLTEGHQLVYTLYSFRSCGRAIPQVGAHNQDNKEHLYRRTYDILRPEIGRMIALMNFRDKFILVFSEVLASILPDIRDRDVFPSEAFLLRFALTLDLCVSLDTMKNMKGSMNNDLSIYKRAMANFPKEQAEIEMGLLHKLAFFLAQPDQFTLDIKKALMTINNTYEDVLHDLLNLCVDGIENERFIIPAMKHACLRAMAFSVALLDGEGEDRDFTKRKRLKVDKIGKIFKATPFVPLFGDIVISLQSIYGKAPHLSHARWEQAEADDAGKAALLRAFKISTYIPAFRIEYRDYISHTKLMFSDALRKKGDGYVMTARECRVVYDTVLAGLRLAGNLTTRVIEYAAYKFLHPASQEPSDKEASESITSYELAVRCNYNVEDKYTLLECIAMIKNLSNLFHEYLTIIQQCIDKTIYSETQFFIKGNINDYYVHASKKKRPIAPLLKFVRDASIDGVADEEGSSRNAAQADDSATREDPISLSQLYFSRAMLDLVFNEKAKGMKGGLMKEKNFKDSQVTELQRFFDESFYYPQMIQFSQTLRDVTDLSNLWFKEFYLELSKRIQFPISTSLPWILTEFILEEHRADTIQYVFYPLDLYNDAGARTLYDLKSSVIFDEIEAEVNLCFDQLMFKLGQRIFVHYKRMASLMALPSDLKIQLDSVVHPNSLNYDSYEFILRQNDLKVLGRSIDVSKLLAQAMNQYLRRSIDVAISRFEASSLIGIIELDSLIESARVTHSLLSEHLELERFEDLLAECDDALSLGSSNGRILSHVVKEFVTDVIPNFCYNSTTQRFIHSPVFYAEPVQRPNFPKVRAMYLYGNKSLAVAYTTYQTLFKDFFGETHIQCIVRVLGTSSIDLIASEVARHAELIIQHTMRALVETVYELCHKTLYYPQAGTGLAGAFDYFMSAYRPLMQFGDIKSEVVQALREIGNTIVVVKSLCDQFTVHHALNKMLMQEFVASDSSQKAYLDYLGGFEDKLPQFQEYALGLGMWSGRTAELTRTTGYPLQTYTNVLRRLGAAFKSVGVEWEAGPEGPINNPKSIFRIWSIIQFVICVPSFAGDRIVRELFGDSLAWTGALFLRTLQQDEMYVGASINSHLLDIARGELTSSGAWPPPPPSISATPSTSPGMSAVAASLGSSSTPGTPGPAILSSPTSIYSAKMSDSPSSLPAGLQRFVETAYFFANVIETALEDMRSI